MTEKSEFKPLEKKFIELLRCGEHKDPLALVQLRLKKLKHGQPCCRCGGSGVYSHFHGTCYRCGGAGYDTVRLTKALYEYVKKDIDAGALDKYLIKVKREQQLKRADNELFRLTNESALAKDYDKIYDACRNNENKAIRIIFRLREEQLKYSKDFEEQRRKFASNAFKDKWKELLKERFNEEEHEETVQEALIDHFEKAKVEIIKINAEYDDFKEMYLTLFK